MMRSGKLYTISGLLALFSVMHVNAQEWETIHTFSPAQTLQDVIFLEGQTWIASSSLYNGTALNMKRSVDNGETWSQEYTGFTSQSFRSIASPDGVVLFAVANESVLITDGGVGEWTQVDIPESGHLRDIYFLNEELGWIGADGGVILHTTDGGQSWQTLDASGLIGGSINDIYFLDENNGFVLGFNFFQRTYDGGLTWSNIEGFEASNTNYQLNEICFSGLQNGWLCGDIGYIYKTEDGGENWVAQNSGTEVSMRGIAFVSDLVGYACGFEGTMLRTFNGGETWEFSETSTEEHLMALDLNGERGIAVSHSGEVLYHQIPMHIDNIKEASMVNVFPNPSSDLIQLSLEGNIEVKTIEVLDLEGKLVLELRRTGRRFDVSMLSPGMYILRVATDGELISKTFIIE